jgi:hypothetical protein
MELKPLGVLKRLDVREIWPNEARDFTPWLVENLSLLGEALGMDLELVTREAPVGAFSLDVLARDLGGNRVVVIENQLEMTDHDHLGKLLTYAAGHDAAAMVWIARELREEHRQALDWLNQHTDENVDFYGVVVEALQIDDSKPACSFKVVAFPNEWAKTTKVPGGGVSPRREAYRAFFQQLLDDLREKHRFTGARAAQPQSWYAFSSGMPGFVYSFSFAAQAQVRAELYIDRGDATDNKGSFDALLQKREAIEREFGEPLQWERLDEKRASRVATYRKGSIDDEPQTLEEIRKWAIEHLLRLKKVFSPHVSALLK